MISVGASAVCCRMLIFFSSFLSEVGWRLQSLLGERCPFLICTNSFSSQGYLLRVAFIVTLAAGAGILLCLVLWTGGFAGTSSYGGLFGVERGMNMHPLDANLMLSPPPPVFSTPCV